MTSWEEWKERNAAWWTPFVAFPVVTLYILGWLIFWLPLNIPALLFHRKRC